MSLFLYATAHKKKFFTCLVVSEARSTLTGHVPPAGTRVPEASSSLLPVTLAAPDLLQSLIIELSRAAEM